MGSIGAWGPTSDFYNNSDYAPAFDNLYTVEIISADDESLKDYIKLQASQVTFGTDELNLKRHEVTKKFYVEDNSFNWTDTLSITWRENESWKVKKFHEKWLSKFYNKETDSYISYPTKEAAEKALYKTFIITLPAYESDKKEVIVFKNVLPKNTGSLSLKWTQTPGVIEHSVDYYVEDWNWKGITNGYPEGTKPITPASVAAPSTTPSASVQATYGRTDSGKYYYDHNGRHLIE